MELKRKLIILYNYNFKDKEKIIMRCKKSDGTYTTVTWLYFYANCSRLQQGLGLCSTTSGGYVAAVTVCNQSLFS